MPFPYTAGLAGEVRVESTTSLAQLVNTRAVPGAIAHLPFKSAATVPVPPAGSFTTTGAQLLLESARGCNPFGTQDPLDPSSWWAIFRYYWAWAVGGDPHGHGLRLADETEQIRYHHRTVLSEQIGLGVGLATALKTLELQYPGKLVRVVDAEAVLANPPLVPGLDQAAELRPDVLLLVEDGPLVLLECKGSRGTSNRIAAMARAMRQLCSLTYQGLTPPGFVVHAAADTDQLRATILDPEGDAVWSTPADRTKEAQFNRRPTVDEVQDVGALRAEAEDLSDATVLAWSGAEESALALVPQRARNSEMRRPPVDLDTTTVTVRDRPVTGVESAIEIGGERFRFFRGLDSDLQEALKTKSRSEASATRAEEVRKNISTSWESTIELDDREIVATNSVGMVSRLTVEAR